MIKNVVFDLGNVVLKLKWNIVIDRYAKEADAKILQDIIFNSKEWIELDRGTLTKEEAIKIMLSKLPDRLHIPCKEIMKHWTDALVINEEIITFIETIRALGYKTYILSNAPLEIPPFLKNKDLEKYFDGKIISAEEKVSKPESQIYEILLERFSLDSTECLFIDDREDNISAAIKCGLNGYVFDYNQFDKFLKDISKYLDISEL